MGSQHGTAGRSIRPRPLNYEERLPVAYLGKKKFADGQPLDAQLIEFLKAQEAEAAQQQRAKPKTKATSHDIHVPQVRVVEDYETTNAAVIANQPRYSALDPVTSAYFRYQDPRLLQENRARTQHMSQALEEYDMDESDEEWLKKLETKVAAKTSKSAKPVSSLTAAQFESLIQKLEQLHMEGLRQRSDSWQQDIKAGRLPKLPALESVVSRSAAVKALMGETDTWVLELLYDHWRGKRKNHPGPLLNHLRLEEPWKTISFAQDGVPCESGDMPFMVVETHNSRDVARLRVNEDDVRERLLEVRDELKDMRTLADQVRKREVLKKQLLRMWTEQLKLGHIGEDLLVFKPDPAVLRRQQQQEREAERKRKAESDVEGELERPLKKKSGSRRPSAYTAYNVEDLIPISLPPTTRSGRQVKLSRLFAEQQGTSGLYVGTVPGFGTAPLPARSQPQRTGRKRVPLEGVADQAAEDADISNGGSDDDSKESSEEQVQVAAPEQPVLQPAPQPATEPIQPPAQPNARTSKPTQQPRQLQPVQKRPPVQTTPAVAEAPAVETHIDNKQKPGQPPAAAARESSPLPHPRMRGTRSAHYVPSPTAAALLVEQGIHMLAATKKRVPRELANLRFTTYASSPYLPGTAANKDVDMAAADEDAIPAELMAFDSASDEPSTSASPPPVTDAIHRHRKPLKVKHKGKKKRQGLQLDDVEEDAMHQSKGSSDAVHKPDELQAAMVCHNTSRRATRSHPVAAASDNVVGAPDATLLPRVPSKSSKKSVLPRSSLGQPSFQPPARRITRLHATTKPIPAASPVKQHDVRDGSSASEGSVLSYHSTSSGEYEGDVSEIESDSEHQATSNAVATDDFDKDDHEQLPALSIQPRTKGKGNNAPSLSGALLPPSRRRGNGNGKSLNRPARNQPQQSQHHIQPTDAKENHEQLTAEPTARTSNSGSEGLLVQAGPRTLRSSAALPLKPLNGQVLQDPLPHVTGKPGPKVWWQRWAHNLGFTNGDASKQAALNGTTSGIQEPLPLQNGTASQLKVRSSKAEQQVHGSVHEGSTHGKLPKQALVGKKRPRTQSGNTDTALETSSKAAIEAIALGKHKASPLIMKTRSGLKVKTAAGSIPHMKKHGNGKHS